MTSSYIEDFFSKSQAKKTEIEERIALFKAQEEARKKHKIEFIPQSLLKPVIPEKQDICSGDCSGIKSCNFCYDKLIDFTKKYSFAGCPSGPNAFKDFESKREDILKRFK